MLAILTSIPVLFVVVFGWNLIVFRIAPFSMSVCNMLPHCLGLALIEWESFAHIKVDRAKLLLFHFVFHVYLLVSALRAGVQLIQIAIYLAVLWILMMAYQRKVEDGWSSVSAHKTKAKSH